MGGFITDTKKELNRILEEQSKITFAASAEGIPSVRSVFDLSLEFIGKIPGYGGILQQAGVFLDIRYSGISLSIGR